MDVQKSCWDELTCDFLTEIPQIIKDYYTILVIVDIFSKQAIFLLTFKNGTAQDVLVLLEIWFFSKHGVPSVIISD